MLRRRTRSWSSRRAGAPFTAEGLLAVADLIDRLPSGRRRRGCKADRRAGRIPHVPSPGGGKQPRARNKGGEWRRKRSDAGSKKGSKPRGILGWLGL